MKRTWRYLCTCCQTISIHCPGVSTAPLPCNIRQIKTHCSTHAKPNAPFRMSTHTHTQCWGKVNAQLNLLIRSTKKKKKNQNQSAHTSISICLACNPRASTHNTHSIPTADTSLLRCLATTPGNKSSVIKFKSPKQQPTPVDKASNWRGRATRANDE